MFVCLCLAPIFDCTCTHAVLGRGGGALIRDAKYLYNKSEAKLRGGLYSKGAYIRVSTVFVIVLIFQHKLLKSGTQADFVHDPKCSNSGLDGQFSMIKTSF